MRIKLLENEIKMTAGQYGDQYPLSDRHPRGAVLIYTLVVLVLMTLMGAALMVNSRTELQISSSTAQGRDAFTKADAGARVALLLGRAYLQPTAGDPRDYYTHTTSSGAALRKTFSIDLDNSVQTMRDFDPIESGPTVQDIKNRYLAVTEAQGKPHLTVKYGDEVVSTAFVHLAYNGQDTGGGSIGERDYGAADSGYSVKAFFVISSQGRLPQESGKGYITEKQSGTHSIVTSIFREILP